MNALLPLAAGDDAFKIVIGVIAVIIWAFGSMASSAKKKQEQARQRRAFEERPSMPLPPPSELPTSPIDDQLRQRRQAAERHREQIRQQLERARAMASARKPAPPRQVAPPGAYSPPQQAPFQSRRAVPQTRAAFVQAPVQPQKPAAPALVTPPAMVQTPVRPAPTTSAHLLHRWLNPRTLRSQFILTEIFQPPLALREPRV